MTRDWEATFREWSKPSSDREQQTYENAERMVRIRLGEDIMPSEHDKIDSKKVIGSLNTILELELAGVVRYLHYSLMVFGHARIPIIGWMRNQGTEGMNHAAMAGEYVTLLGGHPSLSIGKVVESHKHDITQILGEALDHERATLREYYNLLALVVDKSVWLEEYAREQITLEEQHIAEVDKMMRKPGHRVMSGRPPPRCSCGWGQLRRRRFVDITRTSVCDGTRRDRG